VRITEIHGDCFEYVERESFDLVIADPPYGEIVSDTWDQLDANSALQQYRCIAVWISLVLKPGGTAYVWGGIGKPKHRPFFNWLGSLERETDLKVHDVITWSKKRAYGKQDALLFTREECAMLVKGNKPAYFKVPLLEEKRGYAGYNPKYPAKSEYKRRTNVWTDVTEIFQGKVHPCEKPTRLAEIMIETSCPPSGRIIDPFAGSGSTGVAANNTGVPDECVLIEKDADNFLKRLKCVS
jgi:DNA modification methylase